MNGRRHAIVFILGLLLTLFIPAACAQSQDDPSVTLQLTPQTVQVGGTVHISGSGYPQPDVTAVVVITPPGDPKSPASSAPPTTLTVKPDSNGRYSAEFNKTQAAGTYTVNARMGEKGTPATASFTVRRLGQFLDDVPRTEKKLTTDVVQLIDQAAEAIRALPDSPARALVLVRIDHLQAQAKRLPGQTSQLTAALQPLRTLVSDHPETASAIDPLFDKLNAWNEQAQEVDDEINKQIERSKAQLATCDRTDQTIEALKAVSAALNLAAKPYDIVLNFANDYAATGAPSALPGALAKDANAQFSASETAKFIKTAASTVSGPVGMFALAAGLVTDAVTQVEQNAFDKYCQKFQGTFTARMEAKFYAAGHVNDPWWTYTIDIAGKLVLRYPKDATGKAVALTGQFEGGATRFTYDEDVWTHSDLFKLTQGGRALKRDTAPIATPHLDYEGSIVGALSSPTSFYIPVTGQFSNGRITFHLQDARTDFNADYTQGHTFYVVYSAYTLGLPVLGHFSLPFKDAHWVLDHYTFDYPVQQTPDSMFIQKHDERSSPTNGTKAYYTLDLKVCNPACG